MYQVENTAQAKRMDPPALRPIQTSPQAGGIGTYCTSTTGSNKPTETSSVIV